MKKTGEKKLSITESEISAEKTKSKDVKDKKFPVVGLGASAGGLEALKTFFSNVSKDSSMAYIVVIHMAPKQPSMMPELLQKISCIPVSSAKDGQSIEPDHVYVCPPDKEISVYKGKIQLMDFVKKSGVHLPIDYFLRSLAQDQKANVAAIILSGTGTDGTLGVKEIKANEGLILVQSEKSARYDGMPRSAVNTGLADMVLPSDEMPEKLVQYFSHHVKFQTLGPAAADNQEEWLNKIFVILRSQVAHDFSSYKENTLLRRISRRMGLNQIERHEQYVRYMRENPSEVEALFRELLIGVTSFFRDPESFDVLKNQVLPKIFDQMQDDTTFRAWIPGCSTGEEVYSLAIILREYLDANPRRINLQLFGTDIDNYAIDKAREDLFPGNIAADVSKDRLKRFFIKEGNCFRIRKEIRDNVVFSVQDILKDPPFSRLNLLCCRNLLIYLNSKAQKKILPLFHYTLLPGGILVLGSSETIGGFSNLFATLDKKWKIFKKQEISQPFRQQVEFPRGASDLPKVADTGQKIPADLKTDISRLTQRVILEHFAPTAILIDNKGNILHVQGRTGKYLEATSGPPTHNILDLAREGLSIELSSAIRSAKATNKQVIRRKIIVKNNGDIQMINLHVCPQLTPRELAGRLLVVFIDLESQQPDSSLEQIDSDEPAMPSARIAELERELLNHRESHQITIEELESSNEELKSTNEEMQSSNEELQSTYEEMESSKEELQSLNEELHTVNAELQSKLEELSAAHDDIHNLLNSTEIATIFVDNNMCVRRFTQEATKIINLIQTDIGRPIQHVVSNLTYKNMISDLNDVLNNLKPKNIEVQTGKGQWYNMRIIPYRTTNNRIDGAVMTFSDIGELLVLSKVFMEGADPIIIENMDANIIKMNDEAVRVYGWTREELLGKPIKTIVPPDWHEQSEKLLERCKQGESIRNVEGRRWNKNGEISNVLITFSLLSDDIKKPFGIASLTKHIAKRAAV